MDIRQFLGAVLAASLGGASLASTNTWTYDPAHVAITGGTITGADVSGAKATATGATTGVTLATRFSNQASPLDYGAVCDGTTDDTAAFTAVLAASKDIVLPQGRNCAVRNLVMQNAQLLDGNSSSLVAAPGASWLLKLSGFNTRVRNLGFADPNNYTLVATTLSTAAAAGATSISVGSVSGFSVGSIISVALASGTHQVSKVASISGTTITMLDGLRSAAASGAAVQTAKGLLVVDQAMYGGAESIFIYGAPVGISVINSLGSSGNTANLSFHSIWVNSASIAALFLDVNASVTQWSQCNFWGTFSPKGAVGVYQEGRNSTTATGGHSFTDVNAEQAEVGWLINGAQLTNYNGDDGDGTSVADWEIYNGSWGLLNFSNMFASSSVLGVDIQNSPQVFIDGLTTKDNATADVSIDSLSTVWINDQSWGPSRNLTGAGSYNTGNAASVGGSPGNEALRAYPAGVSSSVMETANGWSMNAATSGNTPQLLTRGVDSNINMSIFTKGAGSIYMGNTGGSALSLYAPSYTNNYVGITGAASGSSPVIGTHANSDTNAAITVEGKGNYGLLGGLFAQSGAASSSLITAGLCADWENSASSTLFHACDVGGTIYQHELFATTAPASSVGTVDTATYGSTDAHFAVTGLSAATSVTITFAHTWPYAPYCTGNGAGLAPVVATSTATTAQFTIASLTGTFRGACQ